MKNLFDLFWAFFRVGGLTFGGGYSMLPILQKEIVEQRNWSTNEDIIDYYAVSQCMPGIIAVNTAAFIGYKLKGVKGAIVSAFGVILPSLIIIIAIASFLQSFSDLPILQHAFTGIRVAVVALITNTIIKLWRSSIKDKIQLLIAIIALGITIIFDLSPIYLVIAAALVGLITKRLGGDKE